MDELPNEMEPAVQVAPDLTEDEEPEAVVPEKRKFSRTAAIFYILGILSLLAVCAAPFLTDAERAASADPPVPVYAKEILPIIVAIPGTLAGLVLVGLLAGMITGRLGSLTLVFTYPAALLSTAMLVLATMIFRQWIGSSFQTESWVSAFQATLYPAMHLYVAIVGAAAATLFLMVGVIWTLRRLWTRGQFVGVELLLLGLGVLMHLVGHVTSK
jgi:hypothetical protein